MGETAQHPNPTHRRATHPGAEGRAEAERGRDSISLCHSCSKCLHGEQESLRLRGVDTLLGSLVGLPGPRT